MRLRLGPGHIVYYIVRPRRTCPCVLVHHNMERWRRGRLHPHRHHRVGWQDSSLQGQQLENQLWIVTRVEPLDKRLALAAFRDIPPTQGSTQDPRRR